MIHNQPEKLNILVTLDENYVPYLNVMLASLLHNEIPKQYRI